MTSAGMSGKRVESGSVWVMTTPPPARSLASRRIEAARMPRVQVDGLTINYDVQGEGEPLLLIPYTSADHACWAFQLPAYTEHFSCIAIDLPGSGESDKPPG